MDISLADIAIILFVIIVAYGGLLIPDVVDLARGQGSSSLTLHFRLIVRAAATIMGTIYGFTHREPISLIILNFALGVTSCLLTFLIQQHLRKHYATNQAQGATTESGVGLSDRDHYELIFYVVGVFGSLALLRYCGYNPFWLIPISAALSSISYGLFSVKNIPFRNHCLAYTLSALVFAVASYGRSFIQ